MKLQDRVVWITGASAGIGAALAHRMALEGASLALSARRRDELERVAAGLPPETRCAVVPADVTDLASIPSWVAQIEQRLGPIDVLVNNAGISQRSMVRDTSLETYRRLMEIDFFAPVALTQAVLPSMVQRSSGQVVVMSSVAGKFSTPLRSGYAAAKHALHGFFDALRAEVAKEQIAVTAIVAGAIHTDVSINAVTGDGSAYGVMDELQANGMDVKHAADRMVAGIIADDPEFLVAEGPSQQLYRLAHDDRRRLFEVLALP
jgi:short-subunit dehydrogenase